jgi:hypothetical protein
MNRRLKRVAWLIGFLSTFLMIFYFGWFFHTDLSWVAIVRNQVSGELEIDSVPGWHVRAPWVLASRIDTRPQRVCVVSGGRSFNCKLVQFNIAGWHQFVEMEGFRYYWWSNRISFNGGYSDEYRGMKDLLRGYTFSGKAYPFITIRREF